MNLSISSSKEWKFWIFIVSVLLAVTSAIAITEVEADDGPPIFSTFNAFKEAYQAAEPDSQEKLLDSYIKHQQRHGGFPIIDHNGTVTFFYRSTENQTAVNLIGEFKPESFYSIGWDETGVQMSRLAEKSDVYFTQLKFQADARLEYLFVVSGEKKLDPLNPKTYFNGPIVSDASELVMPKYPLIKEAKSIPTESKGTIQAVSADWVKAPIHVYLPAGYDSKKSYPVIYTADGSAWMKYMKLPEMLDQLIAEKDIEPVIAVMIDPTEDRRNWYLFNPDYVRYLETIIQYVDKTFSTKADARHRFHFGTSAGGRAAFHAAFERP
ncbi:MAG: alpha/beta hydrolase-fold protein, partial [Bdellovibrionota bacterium]